MAAEIAGGLATGDAAGGLTGAQAGRNAVENNFLDVAQLEDFAHRAKVGTGEERKKVIRDMVDTNVRQQDEIREVCTTSPQQCQQRYGYLLDEWELFDDTIKGLAKDKSLPNDFRDYMPAVYMSDVDAGGVVAEHGWTKRFETLGFDADTARVMAATLPAVISGVGGSGGKGNKLGGGGSASKRTGHSIGDIEHVDEIATNKPRLSREELKSAYVRRLIENAEKISTAKLGSQTTVPRDISEQIFWKSVQSNPLQGRAMLGLNRDSRFPTFAGFQKMEAQHILPDGGVIVIHYQYNSNTRKAYDMKITSPQRMQRDQIR